MAVTETELSEARKAGFITPDGDDYISEGDDAISNNAALSFRLIKDARWSNGELTAGTDLNSLPREGHYFARSFSTVEQIINWPPQAEGTPGHVEELRTSSGLNIQRVTIYGVKMKIIQRTVLSATSQTWSEWYVVWARDGSHLPPPVETNIEDAFTQHTIRQTQFMHAMGGPVDTGGRAAVAFRMDHGFKNFAEKLLPLFRARGIVPSMVYNPRSWSRPENDGYTATDLNNWVSAGEVEVWNHGADHSDVSSDADLYDQIVNSLHEIEEQVPAAAGKVWGFAPPGVNGSTGYGGYGSGSSPEKWDTTAGRLILKYHATTAAYLYGTGTRPLDGIPRDGLSHYTMDQISVAEIKGRIDTGIAQRAGVQLMVHPSLIDTPGYITSAEIEEILDYVVSKRAAGDLVTLSPYELVAADSTRPPVPEPSLSDTLERRITTLFEPELTSGHTYIRRIGSTVYLTIYDNGFANSTPPEFFYLQGRLPAGFRPSRPASFQAMTDTNGTESRRLRVQPDGQLLFYGISSSSKLNATCVYVTPDPWPEQLPGTAV